MSNNLNISPLHFDHKLGLFGDHDGKGDLLKISELQGHFIFQVAKFKKSNVDINSVRIDNLNLPSENPHVTSNDQTRVLWSGPNVWIVISKKTDINTVIQSSCNENDFAITDISHSRAAIKLEGPKALDVLKKGSPLNFNEEVFKVNHCASTTYNGINILIDYINSNPKTLHLYALRSFGGSFYHSITDSALEYGYEGV